MNNFKIDTISKNLWHWKCTKILEADIISLDYFSDWPAVWPRGGGGGTAINGLYRLSRVKEKGVKKGWDEL